MNSSLPPLPQQLEAEAKKLCLEVAEEIDKCAGEDFDKAFMRLLDEPDRQATFAANLFAVAMMTKLAKGDVEQQVFDVCLQFCRFIVARKHKLIAIESEVPSNPQPAWRYESRN